MKKTVEQVYFLEHKGTPQDKKIAVVYQLLEDEEFPKARAILDGMVASDNAAALYLSASFSGPDEDVDDYEKRLLRQLKQSADLGLLPALHKLAVIYDTGEYFPEDKERAALMFKRAAEGGYSHSQWIHGLDLIYGRNGIEKNEKLGLEYIRKAAEAKFENALESLAEFYENGNFGLPRDTDKARAIRNQIESGDAIGF